MTKISYLLSALIILASQQIFSQQITDLIQPVRLNPGEADSLLISDLFYSENYNAEFENSEKVSISYNPADKIVVFSPSMEFSGIDAVPFSLNGVSYAIPVISEDKFKQAFKFKPDGIPQKVNLFGSFNGWNRQAEPMYDNDKDGTYEVTVALEPGRYEYKFFVDGKELFDKTNPENVPNGMGDFNSIVTIKAPDESKTFLHKINFTEKTDNVVLSFSLTPVSASRTDINVNKQNVIALLDNTIIEAGRISVNRNNIFIDLGKDQLKSYHTIRVAINNKGVRSNIQTIFLKDGNPVTAENTKLNQGNIIYSLMIDRFNDGDKSNSIPVNHPELSPKANYNGGDLQGVLNKINIGYFDSLGINTIWLSPVIQNTDSAYQEYPEPHRWFTGYHGYWPTHPTEVEEHFGSMDLLKSVISAAHLKNIKILLDYVAHHVHIEHPFWKQHPDWFGVLDLPDGRKNLRLWDEQRLTTWFEPYMPSFNFVNSQAALDTMTDNALWWLKETGTDGFRHDAVKHVPNEYWRLLTKKIKEQVEVPEQRSVYQIGETFGSYDLISSYVNNGQLSAQFNFNLYDTATPVFTESNVPFSALDDQLQKSFTVYGVNNVMGNIIDSHDKVRFMSYADGDVSMSSGNSTEIGWNNPPKVDDRRSYNKLKVFMSYLLTVPGVPVIYYGDEFGMTGANDPDNRRMMRFGNDLSVWEQQTLIDVRKLINIRKNHPALKFGDFLTLKAEKNIYCYLRSDFSERILVILNKGAAPENIKIDFPSVYTAKQVQDLISGDKFLINNNSLYLKIPSHSYKIFILK